MNFELCYPEWKGKAVTFSYDDGQIFDRRLVAMFNEYGLKGTFHLNTGTLDGDIFISSSEVKSLYEGHEVACHGVTHAYPTHLTRIQMLHEYYDDRLRLEELTGDLVRGCSYAFGEYDDAVIETLKSVGIVYSRTVQSTGGFRLPQDFLKWTPTCRHSDAFDGLAQHFLGLPFYIHRPLLYIWGHSFEFDREGNWDKMEQFCKDISDDPDVWYATNIEIYDYVTAARNLIFSADASTVVNPSAQKIYAIVDGERVVI